MIKALVSIALLLFIICFICPIVVGEIESFFEGRNARKNVKSNKRNQKKQKKRKSAKINKKVRK